MHPGGEKAPPPKSVPAGTADGAKQGGDFKNQATHCQGKCPQTTSNTFTDNDFTSFHPLATPFQGLNRWQIIRARVAFKTSSSQQLSGTIGIFRSETAFRPKQLLFGNLLRPV
jgi:hypothetical protein